MYFVSDKGLQKRGCILQVNIIFWLIIAWLLVISKILTTQHRQRSSNTLI